MSFMSVVMSFATLVASTLSSIARVLNVCAAIQFTVLTR